MLTKDDLLNFEKRIADLYRDSQLPFLFHLSGGNEEQLLNIFKEIKEGDYVLATHRNHYHALLHGIPADVLEDRIKNGRSMFIYDRKRNFFTSAIIGGTAAIAAGITPPTPCAMSLPISPLPVNIAAAGETSCSFIPI